MLLSGSDILVKTLIEQGAAHATDGYARTTGKVGVVISTAGPDATNLVTGIATASRGARRSLLPQRMCVLKKRQKSSILQNAPLYLLWWRCDDSRCAR